MMSFFSLSSFLSFFFFAGVWGKKTCSLDFHFFQLFRTHKARNQRFRAIFFFFGSCPRFFLFLLKHFVGGRERGRERERM